VSDPEFMEAAIDYAEGTPTTPRLLLLLPLLLLLLP
jgi:hypothetical protein